MEGLIPFLIHAVKKQKPQNVQRSLSDNSTTGRSYHRLLGGDSVEGSSHRRTRSDFQLPIAPAAAPDNGLRQRAFTSASQYPVSSRI
ncbi:hypothetical protein ACS0TY_001888 [Phlomoides rotata]